MRIGDAELRERLLSYIAETQRKSARVIMSVLADIGYSHVSDACTDSATSRLTNCWSAASVC